MSCDWRTTSLRLTRGTVLCPWAKTLYPLLSTGSNQEDRKMSEHPNKLLTRIRAHPAISHCSHLLLKNVEWLQICHWLKYTLGGSKITYLRKSVFWSAFGFSNIAFIVTSLFISVPYLTLWILDFFQYHQGVKQFGSRSGPTFRRAWSGSKLFLKVISRW